MTPQISQSTVAAPSVSTSGALPFASLQQLQAAHDKLAEAFASKELAGADIGRVGDFIARAAATGRLLDAPSERRIAQGLIDYWVANLYTATRKETGSSAELGSHISQARLEEFDAKVVYNSIADGDKALAPMNPAERTLARRVLFQLVRLPPSGETFATKEVPLTELTSLGDAAQVKRVVDDLVEAGVLRIVPAEGGERIALNYAALTRQWPFLRDLLDERSRFRETALYWERSGRNSGALLNSRRLIENATTYSDLNDLEREFVLRSSVVSQRRLVVLLALTVALAALGGLFYFAFEAQQRKLAAETQKAELVQLKTAQDIAVAQLNAEREQRLAAEKTAADLKAALDQAQARGTVTPTQRVELQSQLEQIVQSEKVVQPSDRLRGRDTRLEPGVSIGPADQPIGGSVCCFVRDEAGQNYLLTAAFVLGKAPVGTKVVRPMEPDGGTAPQDVIGTVVRSAASAEARDAALVQLNSGITVKNVIAGVGPIGGVSQDVAPGQKVMFIGRGSGLQRGVVQDIRKDGLIRFSGISSAGDAGAPVVTDDDKHQLIGMVVARTDAVLAVLVAPILQAWHLTLGPAGEPPS